ncbi:hypothetical protein ONA91_03715 [Micromonospora sp. DR5-3]|uniref:hypothetical protein n=1 Tax=unclassified Micromonospora TaxID=2617518 RepID=UPI0011D4234E|nr:MULTISPECIES: hypothetical protein [unclassified Micromonospora]MCW3813567.1 hypothetical protein [Micromonospora sp. DR5-3]TYC25728.1 hypothetical protein FXF52_04775 [Micromonospora sp. MP36]
MKREELTTDEVAIRDFTEEAAGVLAGHIDSINRRVLQEIARARQQNGVVGRVRADEVSEAIQRISMTDARTHYLGVLRRANSIAPRLLMAVLPIAIAATAAFSLLDSTKDEAWYSAPLVAVSGVSVALLTQFVIHWLDRRAATVVLDAQLFLRGMSRLETDARNYVAREVDFDTAQGPLGAIFAVLASDGIWSTDDINNFRLLLRLRNALVHEQKLELSGDELTAAMEQIEQMRDRIPSWPRLLPPKQRADSLPNDHSDR